jgi:hypothetical protein
VCTTVGIFLCVLCRQAASMFGAEPVDEQKSARNMYRLLIEIKWVVHLVGPITLVKYNLCSSVSVQYDR